MGAVEVVGSVLLGLVHRDRRLQGGSRHDLRPRVLGRGYHDQGLLQRPHEGCIFAGNMPPGDVIAFVVDTLGSLGVRKQGRTDGKISAALVSAVGPPCMARVAEYALLVGFGLRRGLPS